MSYEFAFAWEGASAPWTDLLVSRFEGWEGISEPYRYELTLVTEGPLVDIAPEDLVGRRASLRCATVSSPAYRLVHGVIAEAHEVAESAVGLFYRVVLAPPLSRARHRRRCRIFLEKTLRQIIEEVLTSDPALSLLPGGTVDEELGGPAWSPAEERFTWRIASSPRLDDPRARRYCVQYEESDLDFFSRLLEAEGISYHYEHGPGRCLLVLSDTDAGKRRLALDEVGPSIPDRFVSQVQLGARMRPAKVTVDDFNWEKPALSMRAEAVRPSPGADLTYDVYPGGHLDSAAQGQPLGQARLDRYQVEADWTAGEGSLRVLSAGTVVQMVHPKPRYEGEHLVTALRLWGEQSGVAQIPGAPSMGVPWRARFDAARRGKGKSVAESRFRPAQRTPRPRIHGAQTAIVTAEPGSSAEIDVGGPDGLSLGSVRVKFHWDDDAARHAKEPTSCWVRVSQFFAGAGQGAVWHPRVGVEVIVEHEEGDPDRPLVTGRVYNGKNLPPYHGAPPISTLKSFSTPGGATHNELTFDDTAGGELLFVHAGKDMTTEVVHDRDETVGESAEMHVAAENTEDIGVDCDTSVGANDTMSIGANRTKTIGANRTRTVGADHTRTVGANESRTIVGAQVNTVGGALTETIDGSLTETYQSTQLTHVTSRVTETYHATREVTVSGLTFGSYGGLHTVKTDHAREVTVNGSSGLLATGQVKNDFGGALTTKVGGLQLTVAAGGVKHTAPSFTLNAPINLLLTGGALSMHYLETARYGVSLSLTGLLAAATGLSVDWLGHKIDLHPIESSDGGPKVEQPAIKLRIGVTRVTTCAIFIFL